MVIKAAYGSKRNEQRVDYRLPSAPEQVRTP